jgi:hypothetical protein
MSDDQPVYSRPLKPAEVKERTALLVTRLHEKTLAMHKVAECGRQSKLAKDALNLLEEQIAVLGQELHTGKAMVPKQLELGEVPDLADDDGDVVEDDRETAKPAKKTRARKASEANGASTLD